MEAHLEAAIALNTERRPVYSSMTLGASEELSDILISSERVLLPTARELDAQALPFNEEGIPVVTGDFVPMDDVAAVDAPPRWGGPWTEALEAELAAAVAGLAAADASDFATVSAAAAAALASIDALEPAHEVHLAMSRHTVESVGFAALHAIDYAARSEGRTTALSRELVSAQLAAIRVGVAAELDERAAPIHARGAGILVNDVPVIPFLEEYGVE
jgi:hypothetical protein